MEERDRGYLPAGEGKPEVVVVLQQQSQLELHLEEEGVGHLGSQDREEVGHLDLAEPVEAVGRPQRPVVEVGVGLTTGNRGKV